VVCELVFVERKKPLATQQFISANKQQNKTKSTGREKATGIRTNIMQPLLLGRKKLD
jgi:hypothetical protein